MTMTEQFYNQQQNPLGFTSGVYGQTGQTGIGGYASSPFGSGIGQFSVNPNVNDPYTNALLQQQLGSNIGLTGGIGRTLYNIDPLTAIALQQQQLQQHQLQQHLLGGTSGVGQQFSGNVGFTGRSPYDIDPITALNLQRQMQSQTLGTGFGQQSYGSSLGSGTGMQMGRTNIDPWTALAIQERQLNQLQQQVLQQQLIHQQLLQHLTSGLGYGTGMGSNLQTQLGSQNPYGNVWGSQFGSSPHTQMGSQYGLSPLTHSQFNQGVNPYSTLTGNLGVTGNVGSNPTTQFGTNPFTQGSMGLHPSILRTLSGGVNPQQFSSPWQSVSGLQQSGLQFGQQSNPYSQLGQQQFGQQVNPLVSGQSGLTHGLSGLQGIGGVSQQSVNPLINSLLSSSGSFGNF